MVRTNEWYVSLGMIILSYFTFVFLPDFRFVFLIIFSFVFSAIVARDEWRLGRTILKSVTPLLVSVVLLFVAAFLGSSLGGVSPFQNGQASLAALGCIALLALCLLVGVPLAWAGAQARKYLSPSA